MVTQSELEELFAFQVKATGLPEPEREAAVIPGRKFRFDFAWKQQRLLVEIQGGVWNGGAHGRPTGITRDMNKLNQAQIHGWKVLQFDTKMVKQLDEDGLSEAVKITKEILTNQSNKQEQK